MADAPSRHPGELLDAGPVCLRRQCVVDAAGIAGAIATSLSELRTWMPWATDKVSDVDYQRRRLEHRHSAWELESEFSYVIVDDEEQVLGVMALNDRGTPGTLEVGYWLRSDHWGRGLATACVGALTREGLTLPGVTRLEIHCDEANLRSAAIPRRLGCRLDRIEPAEIRALGKSGGTWFGSFRPEPLGASNGVRLSSERSTRPGSGPAAGRRGSPWHPLVHGGRLAPGGGIRRVPR